MTNVIPLRRAANSESTQRPSKPSSHNENVPPDKLGNLLFGRYRLRLARELLELDVSSISRRYDVSPHTWRKYEDGARRLPNEMKLAIEEDIRSEVSCLIL